MKALVTQEEIGDKIRMKLMKCQTEELKDHWFKKLDNGIVPSQCANQCQGYWHKLCPISMTD